MEEIKAMIAAKLLQYPESLVNTATGGRFQLLIYGNDHYMSMQYVKTCRERLAMRFPGIGELSKQLAQLGLLCFAERYV